MADSRYDGLCLSSGGYKGYAMLGVLTALYSKNCFKRTTYFSGCSVGSIITLLLAIGWKPIELYKRVKSIKIFNGLSDINIDSFKEKYGLLDNQSLTEELKDLILEKVDKIPTFLDLWDKKQIYLAFSITDRITKEEFKVDWKSCPSLLISDGAMMSSNMPFVFPPIDFNNMKAIDGALTNPFPLDYIDNRKRKILGICVYGEPKDDMDSFIPYMTGNFMISIEQIQKLSIKHASKNVDILQLFVSDLNVMDAGNLDDGKFKMYMDGIHDGKLFLKALNKKNHGKNISSKESSSKLKFKSKFKIASFEKSVITKCLISQPLDILCQASLTDQNTIRKSYNNLDDSRKKRLILLCKILMENIDKKSNGEPINSTNNRDNRSDFKSDKRSSFPPTPPFSVNPDGENHSRKLYDSMPPAARNLTRFIFESLSPEDSNSIINGFNSIFDAFQRITGGPLDFKSSKGRVEVLDDDLEIEDFNRNNSNILDFDQSQSKKFIRSSKSNDIEKID